MSARMVRRALEEQEAQRLGESTSDQDEEEHSPTGKPAHNLFDLLGAEASQAQFSPPQFQYTKIISNQLLTVIFTISKSLDESLSVAGDEIHHHLGNNVNLQRTFQ